MGLTIDLYCNDGSPLRIAPDYIYGRGVGGAELSMMTWAETMAKRGHTVRIYNNPDRPGDHGGVTYLPQGAFNAGQRRDVFIAYRSPNPFMRVAKAGVRLHWSTDQYTVGNFGRDIVPYVDKVICISPYHRDYYRNRYGGGDKVIYLDLGVRLEDYDQEVKKIPGRCIFCSIPDRGLSLLRGMWPEIKDRVPEASLVITSDYRLWGNPTPGNHHHKMEWLHLPDIEFVGAVPRRDLVKLQLEAVCQPYPCIYEELFCISTAECQVAGAVPVTSTIGALSTTNEWGTQIEGILTSKAWQRQFVVDVVTRLSIGVPTYMREEARNRFSWDAICEQWEKIIEGEAVTV